MPHRGAISRTVRRFSRDPYGAAGRRDRHGWRRSAVRRDARGRQRWSRAARSGRWRRSCAATSSTRSTPAAASTTRCPTGRRVSASTTTRPSRSPGRDATGCASCTWTSTSITATASRRSTGTIRASLTLSFHEIGAVPVPGDGRGGGARARGAAAGTAINVPLEPGTGEGAWLDGGSDAAPRGGRRVRAGHRRLAARRRFARLGSARAPAGDDDRDGRGGPARRRSRPSMGGRPVAGDRRRRLRRLPGRAASLEPRLAGRRTSRGPDATPVAWRETLGRRGGAVRSGADARGVRRPAERRRAGRLGPGGGRVRSPQRPWRSCGGSSFPGSSARRATAAGGSRSPRPTPAPTASRRETGADGADPTIIEAVDSATWDRLTLAPRRHRAVRSGRWPTCWSAAGLRDGLAVTAAVVGTTVVGLVASRIGRNGHA